MLLTKLKTPAPVGAAAVALVLWAVTPVRLPSAPLPKPAPPGEGTFIVGCVNNSRPDEVAALVGPDGAALGFVAVGEAKCILHPRVSPDGKRLAYLRQRPYAGKPTDRGRSRAVLDLYVADIGGKDPPTEPVVKDPYYGSFAWAPDGKRLYVSSLPAAQKLEELIIVSVKTPGELVPVKTRLVDLATRKETPLDIPEGHGVCDVTPDGKTVLTRKIRRYPDPIFESCTSYLVPLATLKPKAITPDEEGFNQARFSPDGKRVAGVRPGWMMKSKEKGLFVYDIAAERLTPVAIPKDIPPERLEQVAWAPDGKRLAVLWWVPQAGGAVAVGGPPGAPVVRGDGHPIHRITSFDPNGANAKMVQEFKARPFDYAVNGFDWADLGRPGAGPRE